MTNAAQEESQSKSILTALLDLESSGKLISISISGLPGTYLSVLLKADVQRGTLLFDGLRSSNTHQVVKAGVVVSVRAKLGFNDLAFDCIVDAPFQLNTATSFSAHFPSSLHLSERRNSYRVRIPESLSIPAVQLETEERIYEGRLLDISRQGSGVLMSVNNRSAIGNRVSCSFQLLDTQFKTYADVRSAAEINSQYRLGLRLVDLSAADHKKLDATIASLERTILRDHARLTRPAGVRPST